MSKNKRRGFSIRIFLPDGEADGLKLVEKSNWSGRGVVCPRALFPGNKGRDEFARTGIYILIGPSESGDVPTVYIGQGDPVRARLESHYAKKDFWTAAAFFVSKDENLNKAHIGYLESRLIALAKEAKRSSLDNANAPALPSMSEMDIADAEGFLDEALLCLPVLGVNVFTKPEKTASQRNLLVLHGKDTTAKGFESAEGFVVLSGGLARTDEVTSIHDYISSLRDSLVERGIRVPEEKQYRLAQDYTFNSPSQAAAVMLGRSANGRVEWKDAAGTTLKEIQERSAGSETRE
ncbi:MAG: GIY-YIG nuclease family protein [Verrucomicrobiales bacterium]